MNKEFIPYEEALALKELGFDEPCFGYFYHENMFTKCHPNIYHSNTFTECDTYEEIPLDSCKTPLYQQAFRWFRKKHGLSSYVRLINLQGKSYWKIDKVETEDKIKGYSSFENSYEGSELECLKKLIELITIKNNE